MTADGTLVWIFQKRVLHDLELCLPQLKILLLLLGN